MKFSLVAVSALFAGLASAAPLEARAGPSGQLQSPAGGTTVGKGEALHVSYKPVSSQGQTTTSIDLTLIESAKADVRQFNLATSLSASSKQCQIDAYFRNITAVDVNGNVIHPCGSYYLEVTEKQTGPIFNGSFRSAFPAINFEC